jgi:hypothetical protein
MSLGEEPAECAGPDSSQGSRSAASNRRRCVPERRESIRRDDGLVKKLLHLGEPQTIAKELPGRLNCRHESLSFQIQSIKGVHGTVPGTTAGPARQTG